MSENPSFEEAHKDEEPTAEETESIELEESKISKNHADDNHDEPQYNHAGDKRAEMAANGADKEPVINGKVNYSFVSEDQKPEQNGKHSDPPLDATDATVEMECEEKSSKG